MLQSEPSAGNAIVMPAPPISSVHLAGRYLFHPCSEHDPPPMLPLVGLSMVDLYS